MSKAHLVLLMVLAGAMTAIQPSINGRLAQRVGLLESSFVSFLVGALCLLGFVALQGRGDLRGLMTAAWWEWTGGLLAAVYVTLLILGIPRLGTAAALSAVIAGQLTTGLLLDATNLFGFGAQAITLPRLAGVALLFLGAWLVRG